MQALLQRGPVARPPQAAVDAAVAAREAGGSDQPELQASRAAEGPHARVWLHAAGARLLASRTARRARVCVNASPRCC
jgi:hypothetical protein